MGQSQVSLSHAATFLNRESHITFFLFLSNSFSITPLVVLVCRQNMLGFFNKNKGQEPEVDDNVNGRDGDVNSVSSRRKKLGSTAT